jgi:PAS domain S-box-containing protein
MEGRYRGLLEAAPDAMAVVNQEGRIVLLNLQAEKEFGYHRDELLGQKVTNIIPEGFAERLIADGLRSAEDALAQQIGTGIELIARRKDRTEFPIELMLSPLESAEELRETSSEETLGQAIMNLRGAIQESGALVTHDPLPPVMADERQLIQLFQNLVGNAIKYQSPGVPKVHISAAKNGGKQWTFSVQDNGLGIDPQYFERIFGMFQRLHKREEFAGTGIGLAICKKIVERHGGSISVESQPGEGSTFRFGLAASEEK